MAAFIMTGPLQATGFVVLFALIGLFLPLIGLLSNAALGLVTLRTGWQNGSKVLFYASAVFAPLTLLIMKVPALSFGSAFIQWLPVVILAALLQRRESWQQVLQLALAVALMSVLVFHLLVADPVAFWKPLFEPLLKIPFFQQQFPDTDKNVLLEASAKIAIGIAMAIMMITIIASLMLARHWQASLYNPGGFKAELEKLSLGRMAGIVMMIMTSWVLLTGYPLLVNLVIAGLAVFIFQGIALVHSIHGSRNLHIGWLIGFYVLLVLLPELSILLATLGIIDSVANLRKQIVKH